MIRQKEDLLQLWEHISEHLVGVYGREFFQSWLSPLKVQSIEDKALVIHAPNYLTLNIIHSSHLSEMVGKIKQMPEYADQIDMVKLRLVSDSPTLSSKKNFPKYSFDTFLTGASNEFAREIVWKIMEENVCPPFPFIYLQGEIGCGKTHLVKALEEFLAKHSRKKVKFMTADSFVRAFVKASKEKKDFQEIFEPLDLLMLDDVERFKNKKGSQEALTQIINALVNKNKVVMVSSYLLPKQIDGIDSRLLSHFNSGVLARIDKPDPKLRQKIISRANKELGGQILKETAQYISSSLNTSTRELLGACSRIIYNQKFHGRLLTVTETKELLKDLLRDRAAYSNDSLVREIMGILEEEFSVPRSEILKKRNTGSPKQAKYVLAHIITQKLNLGYQQVRQYFPEKEVMTVQATRYAVREVKKLSLENKEFCQKLIDIEKKVSQLQKQDGI